MIFKVRHVAKFCTYVMMLLIVIPLGLLAVKLLTLPLYLLSSLSTKSSRRTLTLEVFPLYLRMWCRLLCVHRTAVSNVSIAPMHTIILANHRSWADFGLDNALSNSTSIARMAVPFALLFTGLLLVLECRLILLNRGRVSKESLYEKMQAHMQIHERNVILYPEGKRMAHMQLSSVREALSTLKPGLLWMIYTKGEYPVQVVISSNKERLVNEKHWTVRPGVTIRTYVGQILHPRQYDSFESFMSAIALQWHEAWTVVYSPSTAPSTMTSQLATDRE